MKVRRTVLSLALASLVLNAPPVSAAAPSRTKAMKLEASFASGKMLGDLVARPERTILKKTADGSYALEAKREACVTVDFWVRHPMQGVQPRVLFDLLVAEASSSSAIHVVLNGHPANYTGKGKWLEFQDHSLILDEDALREGKNVLVLRLDEGDLLRGLGLRSDGLDVIFADKHMKPAAPPAAHPDSLRLAEAEELMRKGLQQAASGLDADALTSLSACVTICDALLGSSSVEVSRRARTLKQKAAFSMKAIEVE